MVNGSFSWGENTRTVDGNPDWIHGLINFGKRRLIFRVISEISRYQQNAYNLHPVPQVTNSALPKLMCSKH